MSLLESQYAEPFTAWKAKQSPETNSAMLDALHPVIEGAVRAHVGEPDPLLMSKARRMTLEGLHSYDPSKGKLKTHLYGHLQGMKRAARQQGQILKVPERVSLDRSLLEQAETDLSHVLGRDPSDAELSDHTGFSPRRMARVRSFLPAAAEGTIEEASGGVYGSLRTPGQPAGHGIWQDIVYHDLSPFDQKVMEHALGMHGRMPLSNQEIAAKLRRSPSYISQRAAAIQKLLDQEDAVRSL